MNSDNEEITYMDLENVVIEEITSDNLGANELEEFVPAIIPAASAVQTEISGSFAKHEPGNDKSYNPNLSRLSVIASTSQYQNMAPSTASDGTASEPEDDRLAKTLPIEQEELLIKKLIDGVITFSDYNLQIGNIVDDNIVDDDDQDDVMEVQQFGGESAAEKQLSDREKANVTGKFESELFQSRKDALRGNLTGRPATNKSGRVLRRRCILPPALQGLMGEANLCYARGQTELAEKLCLEIIRQVPLAPEPFLTLAQINESNTDKYMQFSLIAAHLNPGDIDQWMRIAQLSLDEGNIKQAISCYMKAIKHNPYDIGLRLRRIELLESIGEEKLVYRCIYCMLPIIPAERGDFLMEKAKLVANYYLKQGHLTRALESLKCAYTKVPQLFKIEDVNFYLELLITTGAYRSVLDVLCYHADVELSTTEMDGQEVITSCLIPDNIILDFRSKLIVSFIHLRTFHLLDQLFANVFRFIGVEEAGDCYLDIAEALMKEEQFSEALKMLVPLVKSKNFSLAAVWLRHADCYRAIGKNNDAINSYKQVVELAPQHFEARIVLSALLKQAGRTAEAMAVLEQDLENEVLDPYVLYERCYMLKETGNYDQFIDCGFLLLTRNSVKLRNREEMQQATTIVRYSTRISTIKEYREARSEPFEDNVGPEFLKSDNEPPLAKEWDLFLDIVSCACERKRFSMVQKLSFTMMTSKAFVNLFQKELDFIAILASVYNRDSSFSYVLSKELVTKHPDIPRVWNFFNIALQFGEDIRYSRFLLRFFKRMELSDIEPALIRANYFLLSGSYKYALNDYVFLYKKLNIPMLPLLIAITFCHLAQQKFIEKKHSLVAQSLAFMSKYKESREPEAPNEVHYNLGRLYHQFGIINLAVFHYTKVLNYDSALITAHAELLDLRKEAAFNLHLIYKASGNFDLARKTLYDYIVV